MKADSKKVTMQDRLATWEEIQRATASTPDQMLKLLHTNGSYCEVDSDLGGIIRYPAEEFEFFSFLSEMDDSPAN
jgi:hypothetical protein